MRVRGGVRERCIEGREEKERRAEEGRRGREKNEGEV
jgi:hypothetical protein